jgi:hypothetical protein
MKPTFALNLSNERVGLLHRTGRGWLQVGDVAFDTPDLTEALAYLRRTALGLSPRGVSTKLVIPNSQILYIDVEAPGPDDETRRKQIAAGLVGRTPYAPDDLVFDWRGKGTMVKVAVVAKETLAEAEAFAVEHRFSPVSFVAMPDASQFKGEPYFGLTAAAKTILTKGEEIEPDRDLMTIVTRDLPVADPAPTPEKRAEKRAADKAAKAEALAKEAAEASESRRVTAAATDVEPATAARMDEVVRRDAADPVEVAQAPVPDIKPILAEPAPAHSRSATGADEAPFAHIADRGSVTDDTLNMLDDDLPPAPSKAAQMAFASRRMADDRRMEPTRSADRQTETDPLRVPDRPAAPKLDGAEQTIGARGDFRGEFVAKRGAPALKTDAQVTAPSIPGSKKRKGSPATPPPAVLAAQAALASSGAVTGASAKPLTRPGGTFGAKPQSVRGKPKYLGLILTGVLLALLALAAGLSAYSTQPANTTSGALETSPVVPPATEPVPAIDDEMAADQQDVGDFSGDVATTDVVSAPELLTPDVTDGAADVANSAGDSADQAEIADPQALPATDVLPDALPSDSAATDQTTTVADQTDTGLSSPVIAPQKAGSDLAVPLADDTAVAPATADVAVADVVPDEPAVPVEPASADVAATTQSDPVADAPEAEAPQALAQAPAVEGTLAAPAPQAAVGDQPADEIFLATADTAPVFQDALILPTPALTNDVAPAEAPPPPPFGTVYRFDAAGLIVPTAEGILSPEGIMLFAGPPPLVPTARPAAVLSAASAPVAPVAPVETATGDAAVPTAPIAALAEPETAPVGDPAMAGFRPRPRPAGLIATPVENADDASLPAPLDPRQAALRPRTRPDTVLSTASAASAARTETANASLTAQADAAVQEAMASAAATGNIMTLAVSRRPAAKPRDMSRAVEAALAAAVRAPTPVPEPEVDVASNNSGTAAEPEADAEPETASAAPKIPTKATVAKQATFANAINLSKINLIGVYGTPSKRYALIRLATGRYKKVSVGDSVDGGSVQAITASEVRYQKGGRLVSLKLPKA